MLVYKYRGGDSEIFKRDLECLENNLYYASSSLDLNDPCETITDSEKLISQSKSFSKYLGFKSKESLKVVDEAYRNVLSFDKKMGIYSLSQTYIDELLWAHYGNSHKGFCIEYELDLLLESYKSDEKFSFPVTYNNKPPVIGMLDIATNKNNSIVRKMGGFKSKRWAYEQEYRILTNNFGLHAYNYQAVKSIYFGLRMDNAQKTEIMNRLKGRGIKYFQIEQIPTSYKFRVSPIKDDYGDEITYLSQIPSKITNTDPIKFEIIDKDYWKFNGKATINIELNSVASISELEWLAKTIRKNLFIQAERIFMFYYTKSQKDKDAAWATSHFENGEIKVKINEYVKK
ncbi:DUF2971 domain-containing protein [uncultured Croceitalea sp.]|uniref:DUF2971 domain-containing protein n=1 Tax=uncultured Croceitalea sp. TaxID=1798908 RepID=UPI00374E2335